MWLKSGIQLTFSLSAILAVRSLEEDPASFLTPLGSPAPNYSNELSELHFLTGGHLERGQGQRPLLVNGMWVWPSHSLRVDSLDFKLLTSSANIALDSSIRVFCCFSS